jgi:carbamoyl-phosphate synthase large subunit
MKIYNILVFPGGTETGLEIHKALCQRRDMRLFSAGVDISNHAPYVFQRHCVVPDIHDPSWIDALNCVIREYRIDYIYPTHDDVIVALCQNADRIEARIISSPLETCLVCRSKLRTYSLLSDSIPAPRVYTDVDAVDEYPVFVKPDKGRGSLDTHLVHDEEHLRYLLRKPDQEYITLEYLPGDEYTVDCFSDRDAGLLFCGPRQRLRIKAGISVDSRPVRDPVFFEYARIISKRLKFHGAWFFQVKKDRYGVHKLLEVAPRIAGAMALYRVLGINFPLLSIYEQERIPVKILLNNLDVEIDRALVNRYRHNLVYDVVYVDLDDTLVINGAVNVHLVKYLYQCINKGIRLILLTQHAGDLRQTLERYRLAAIFDDVIQVEPGASKADYINEASAILIDDSFTERLGVFQKRGIPTFDCAMLEMLMDDRR